MKASETFEDAPCVGRWEIFDAPNARAAREAQLLCAGCPVALECRALSEEQSAEAVGVWAGEIAGYDGPRGPRPIEHGTYQGYGSEVRQGLKTCRACKAAAAAYERARKARRGSRTA